MKIIKVTLLKREPESKDEFLAKRLELFKSKAWDKYEQIVKDHYIQTQDEVEKVISLVCQTLKVEIKLYEDTNSFYERDPSSW